MSTHPDFDDKDLAHDPAAKDPLAEVYTEMVSPDIAEINEHAKELAQDAQSEPDSM